MWQNRYIGIRFIEKGRDRSGLDCYGLLRLIYKEQLNIDLPDYLDVYENVNDKKILNDAIQAGKESAWIDVTGEPEPFDVLILRMRGLPIHLGIVTKPGFMLHCAKDINTVHEKYTSLRWKDKIVGFNRWAR